MSKPTITKPTSGSEMTGVVENNGSNSSKIGSERAPTPDVLREEEIIASGWGGDGDDGDGMGML